MNARLNIAVFVCGFVVMAFEIIGSRVLAPFLGTSTYVWVSIIGIILLAMSAGYYYGGKRADKQANITELARYMLLAAAAICLMNLGKNQVLMFLGKLSMPLLMKTIIASLLMFSIPAFFLAAVFPYALRLVLQSVENSGATAGRFYALSTLGSITGTFLSATVLIPSIGTTNILWVLAAVLIALAIWLGVGQRKWIAALSVILLIGNVAYAQRDQTYVDVDTSYNRVWIFDAVAQGRDTRYMSLNGHVNSGIWVDDPVVEQLYPYSDYFRLAMHFNRDFDKVLMLGAGAYSFPKLYQHLWPQHTLDVVEIDGELTELSKEFFAFEQSGNTDIIHEDARTYINRTEKSYDIILSDVFTSPLEVPFQMSTFEVYTRHFELLNEGGVLVLNVLGNAEGEHSDFLKSQVKLARSVFPSVALFEVEDGMNNQLKNNMLVAVKSKESMNLTSLDPIIQAMLDHRREVEIDEDIPLLTDDFGPANWLLRL